MEKSWNTSQQHWCKSRRIPLDESHKNDEMVNVQSCGDSDKTDQSKSVATDQSNKKKSVRESTVILKKWLRDHNDNPYPTKNEKLMLSVSSNMTLTQVSTWFANARRRLKKTCFLPDYNSMFPAHARLLSFYHHPPTPPVNPTHPAAHLFCFDNAAQMFSACMRKRELPVEFHYSSHTPAFIDPVIMGMDCNRLSLETDVPSRDLNNNNNNIGSEKTLYALKRSSNVDKPQSKRKKIWSVADMLNDD